MDKPVAAPNQCLSRKPGRKKTAALAAVFSALQSARLDRLDCSSLLALGALLDFEGDLLAFLQRLEAA